VAARTPKTKLTHFSWVVLHPTNEQFVHVSTDLAHSKPMPPMSSMTECLGEDGCKLTEDFAEVPKAGFVTRHRPNGSHQWASTQNCAMRKRGLTPKITSDLSNSRIAKCNRKKKASVHSETLVALGTAVQKFCWRMRDNDLIHFLD